MLKKPAGLLGALLVLCFLHPQIAEAQCTVTCSATVPASGAANASIAFESRSAQCACESSPTYAWTFGDGGTSTQQNPSHTYSAAGIYSWQLTVTAGSTICTRSGSIAITAGGSVMPSAGTYSGTTTPGGQAFSITVNGSSQITSWTLGHTCFGTGTTTVNTTCTISNGSFTCGNAFCSPFVTSSSISGTFTSSTAVSGNTSFRTQPNQFSSCCSQNRTFSAALSPQPLSADASSDVSNGAAPLTVNFTASASGGSPPYTYGWDFGDCSPTSSTQNPSRQYLAGSWTAFLTVTDSASATARDTVDIVAAGPAIDSITPNSGPPGGGTAVTIAGVNLGNASSVTFGGAAASITGNTPTSINVTTPAHAAGAVDVVVTTPGGTVTSGGGYTYSLPPFGAPAGLTATAISTGQVNVTWAAVADVQNYEVVRSTGAGFVSVAVQPGIGYMDTNVSASNSYVYKVRAINSSGILSAYSAPDAATTVFAEDDPLLAGTTLMKAVHLTALRIAVNAMLVAAGLPQATFTDSSLAAGMAIRKAHIEEARAALDSARSTIGLPPITYTDPTLITDVTPAKAAHVQEIRNGCK